MSRRYVALLKLSGKKNTKQSVWKMGKGHKDTFHQRSHGSNKPVKMCLTSLAIRERQIKTRDISLHTYEKTRKTNKQNTVNTKCCWGYRETGSFIYC